MRDDARTSDSLSAFDPDDSLLVACRRLSRQMDLFDDAASAALGVGRSDLRALNLLERGPLSPAVIAERLGLTRAAVTTLLDRLEASRYVARTRSPRDRRAVAVELLPATWAAFAHVYRPLGERVSGAASALTSAEQSALLAGLEALDSAFALARTQLREPDPDPSPGPGT